MRNEQVFAESRTIEKYSLNIVRFFIDSLKTNLLRWTRKEKAVPHICLGIWPECFYPATVNRRTMRESFPFKHAHV